MNRLVRVLAFVGVVLISWALASGDYNAYTTLEKSAPIAIGVLVAGFMTAIAVITNLFPAIMSDASDSTRGLFASFFNKLKGDMYILLIVFCGSIFLPYIRGHFLGECDESLGSFHKILTTIEILFIFIAVLIAAEVITCLFDIVKFRFSHRNTEHDNDSSAQD